MRYIDQDKIYEATDGGLSVFQYYFPNVDLNNPKAFFSIRDNDGTPSARVTWYDHHWRITDFGNQSEVNGLKAVDFVMWRENLNFYEALIYVEQVVIGRTIEGKEFQKIKWAPDYAMRELQPSDKKGNYNFVFKEKPALEDLNAIGRYVTTDTLEYFHCRVVEQYEYCGKSKWLNRDVVHIFKSNKNYPIFLFDYGTFRKLYRPHEMEKKNRFLYIGQKPKDFIYGLEQLMECNNEFLDEVEADIAPPQDKPTAKVRDLFRCSGESDALNLHSLGFHVYWLNSESAEFTYEQFKLLDDLCENHYQIMDLDATGLAQALRNALKHINIYSIELPAWLRAKKDFRGNPCKDLKDFINLSGENQEQTYYNFLVLKRNARRIKFWQKTVEEKSGKTTYALNMEFFFFFLRANGFYQMESIYHKGANYCYAWIKGKAIDLIAPDAIKRIIKRFTKEWIKSKNLMDAIDLLNKINTSNQLTEGNLETIDEIKVSFKNHNRFTEYLNFRNGSIRITKDKIERVKHDDLPNYILGFLEVKKERISHLIDRDIRVLDKPPITVGASQVYQKLLDQLSAAKSDEERELHNAQLAQLSDLDKYQLTIHDEDFIFVRFLRDLSRLHWRKELEKRIPLTPEEKKEQDLALANYLFVLGYHCSQYKDPGKPWLTFLQDMRITEIGQSSGRSGKSLLSQAITHVRASFYKGGRSLDDKNQYQFFYDGLTEFHDFIEIDDMHEYADFAFFYTQVTGKREVNPKNYTPFTLEYEDSGKMLISSNFELQNVDSSTVARLLNCGVSDYYHEATKFNDYKETRTPLTKFGRRLYDDFTDEEWIKFYNLIAYCIQLTMRFYKIQPPMMNLEKRQLRRAMSQGLGKDEDFFNWANDYFTNCPLQEKPSFSPADQGWFNTLVIRENAFEALKARLSRKQQIDYRSGKFKNHIQAWCDYYGFELNPIQLCTGSSNDTNRRIIKSVDGRSMECFYISTKPAATNEPEDNEKPPF
ncbi:MAG: hypothetical protein IPH20_09715 [Bacteroidales bacterium]|nr:hypothetical protein [Bacteroidales bacterium]